MTKSVFAILFLCMLMSCVSSTGQQSDSKTTVEVEPELGVAENGESVSGVAEKYTVEDTILNQLGGKLYYLELLPTDKISVIESRHYTYEGNHYVDYRFIEHNKHSKAHLRFEPATLDSIYKSETEVSLPSDSAQVINIDPSVDKYTGYWVYLSEYNNDYYLDKRWDWIRSFHLSATAISHHYMDGVYPFKILRFAVLPKGGFVLDCSDDRGFRCELVDAKRNLFKTTDGDYITPASGIHAFEIIQYTNNTGDLI